MDISKFDLNLLLVLRAVRQERSVTRAAHRLGVSQPAVSTALARLRTLLKDPLFVRSRGGMEPTVRATQLFGLVDEALGAIYNALQQHEDFDCATSNVTFDLLLSDVGEVHYVAPLVEYARRAAPGITFRIHPLNRATCADDLASGTAHLAIGSMPSGYGLSHRDLFTGHFVCLSRKDHPLVGEKLTLAAYLEASHLVVSQHGFQDYAIADALSKLNLTRKIVVSVPHFIAVPTIVANTDLIVTVPDGLVDHYRNIAGLAFSPLPFVLPQIQVSLFWYSRYENDAANRWLRDIIVKLFDRERNSATPSANDA